MSHLTLIVATDKPWKAASDLLEMTLGGSGVEYAIRYEREEILAMRGIPISDSAVIYVHGNFGNRYANVGITQELAVRRPDLKFIIAVDPTRCSEEDFARREDYALVRQFFEREREFHARHQINISPHDPPSFITGRDALGDFEPIEQSLARYVQQWKELQET